MPDLTAHASRDQETATRQGGLRTTLPDGVLVRDIVTHTDERGSLFVLYDPREVGHPDPLVYLYGVTIRPGIAKGWAMHERHEDRYLLVHGDLQVVLYDAREDSSTSGLVTSIVLSEHRRQLLTIPTGIWHADWNVGTRDVLLLNCPTEPYDYERPDKLRLPLDTDLVPFDFPPGTRGG